MFADRRIQIVSVTGLETVQISFRGATVVVDNVSVVPVDVFGVVVVVDEWWGRGFVSLSADNVTPALQAQQSTV